MTTKVLVAYATRYGATREVAATVAGDLSRSGLGVSLQEMARVADLEGMDAVVLGAPLYVGRFHRDARRFLARHHHALAQRPVALFVLGPVLEPHDEREWRDARAAVDGALASVPDFVPLSVSIIGGRYDPARLRFPDTLLARLPASPLSKLPASDTRDWAALRAWTQGFVAHLKAPVDGATA